MEEDRPAGDISSWSVPGSFVDDGVLYPGEPFSREALISLKAGNIPEHEVAVATYPRSGQTFFVLGKNKYLSKTVLVCLTYIHILCTNSKTKQI